MDNEDLYYPKELSWLAFNERVLQEAADKNNPAVERIRFLGIYSNNLDEFYRVRAADVKRQITIAQNDGNEEEAERQTALMALIQKKVVQLSEKFDQTFDFAGRSSGLISGIDSKQMKSDYRNDNVRM